MVEYKILTTISAIEAIAPEWKSLHARAGETQGLFTDPDSFLVWWRTVGQTSRKPCVVTARTDGRLAGVLPLAVSNWHGLRILQAAGYKALSICEMLCETPGPELADGLWKAIKNAKNYHFADIRDVYADSPAHRSLARFATRRDISKAHSLDLASWKSGEDWFRSLPRDMRHETERKLRKLDKKGPVSFRIYNGVEDGPFPETIVNELLRHKLNWCQTRDKDGLFSHPKASEFYRELARAAAQRNAVNIGWLCCKETAIGYTLNFRHQGTVAGYVTGYDPEWSPFSPGILTLAHAIRWAIDHGEKSYDLNQGDYQYKQKFSNTAKECAEFTFSAPTLAGWLAEKLYFWSRTVGRRLRKRQESAKTPKKPNEQGKQGNPES